MRGRQYWSDVEEEREVGEGGGREERGRKGLRLAGLLYVGRGSVKDVKGASLAFSGRHQRPL
jgi:hypothetical protein